jgi:hypothetical protein
MTHNEKEQEDFQQSMKGCVRLSDETINSMAEYEAFVLKFDADPKRSKQYLENSK